GGGRRVRGQSPSDVRSSRRSEQQHRPERGGTVAGSDHRKSQSRSRGMERQNRGPAKRRSRGDGHREAQGRQGAVGRGRQSRASLRGLSQKLLVSGRDARVLRQARSSFAGHAAPAGRRWKPLTWNAPQSGGGSVDAAQKRSLTAHGLRDNSSRHDADAALNAIGGRDADTEWTR